MNELYWIERLDAVNVTFVIILIVALVWLVYVFIESNVESYSEKNVSTKGYIKRKSILCYYCNFSFNIDFYPYNKRDVSHYRYWRNDKLFASKRSIKGIAG